MRIRRLYLNGFGIHRDRTFDLDMDAQVVVFYGRNEAGKSTLMGFIRSMLFGFPKRNNRIERYEPLSGGMHGGVLTILDHIGQEIRIERYEKNGSLKLLFSDGVEAGEAALQSLLGGLTADLYKNLFAFSLSELQRIDTLHAEEISGFLLSAGMGISGATMTQAERKLTQQMDALYKPQGIKQAINEQLQIIEQSELELRRSKEKSGKFTQWQVELASLDSSIVGEETELIHRRAELDWLNKCIQSRETWMSLLEVESELRELPTLVDFPEDSLARYVKLYEDLERVNKQYSVTQQERTHTSEQMNSIKLTLNEKLIAHRSELEQLLETAAVYSDSTVRIAEQQADIDGYQVQLQRYLRQISPDWTEDDLLQFPISIHHQEQVKVYAEQFDNNNHRLQSLLNERERIEEQAEQSRLHTRDLHNRRNEISQVIESKFNQFLAIGSERLHASEQEVSKLWDRIRKLAADFIHLEERLADAMRNEQLLLTTRGSEHQRVGQARPGNRTIQILAIAINIIIPVWIIVGLNSMLTGVSMFILIGIFTIYTWFPKTAKLTARSKIGESIQRDVIIHRERLEKDAEQIGIQWIELCDQLYSKLSVYPGGSSGQFEAAAGRSRHDRRVHIDVREGLQHLEPLVESFQLHINDCKLTVSELHDAENELRVAQRELEEIEKRLTTMLDNQRLQQQKHDGLKLEWEQWLNKYQLPVDLSVVSMKSMFQYAESALQVVDQLKRMNSKLTAYEEALHTFEQRAAIFLREQDLDHSLTVVNMIYELKKLKELLEGQVSIQEQCRHMEMQLSELVRQEQICSGNVSHIQVKMSELLATAKVTDEDELRKLVRLNDRRLELEQSRRHLQVVIFTWVKEEHQHRLFQTLEQSDVDQLQQQLTIALEATAQLETSLNECKDRRGGLRKEMDNLQDGGQHADLLQRHQEHIAEFQQLASKWAELAISAELMRRAKDIYERERQPGVLLRASHYIRTITNGQFVRVVSRLGEKSIFVERESGEQLDSILLSRGTAEQLYLAMRFALADEYSKTVALPLIMDDIFVNFDADRLSRTLTVLSDVAQRHQIILFTCHEHVAQAMKAKLPHMQMINLEEGR